MASDAMEQKLSLLRPSAGEVLRVVAESGRLYALGFDSSLAEFAMDEGNLTIRFDDGGVILLQDFLSAADASDLTLELADGAQVLGADIVEMLGDAYLDIRTDVAGAASGYAGALLVAEAGEAALSPILLSSGDIPACGGHCPVSGAEGAPSSFAGPGAAEVFVPAHDRATQPLEPDIPPGNPNDESPGNRHSMPAGEVLALGDLLEPAGAEVLAPAEQVSAFTSLVDTATAEFLVSGGGRGSGAEDEAALLSFWLGGVF